MTLGRPIKGFGRCIYLRDVILFLTDLVVPDLKQLTIFIVHIVRHIGISVFPDRHCVDDLVRRCRLFVQIELYSVLSIFRQLQQKTEVFETVNISSSFPGS